MNFQVRSTPTIIIEIIQKKIKEIVHETREVSKSITDGS
jgi:hypothetical protein